MGGTMHDDEAFCALVAAAERDRQWMRRVRRHIRIAAWKKEIIRWSLACGALGPAGTCLATTEAWILFTEVPSETPATKPAHSESMKIPKV
jgi:hypothetical protein